MNVIMVPYRHQNKKAFIVARISSNRHTLYASDNRSELLRQTLARNGSTKTGPFHGLRQHPVHDEGPPHYESGNRTYIITARRMILGQVYCSEMGSGLSYGEATKPPCTAQARFI